MKPLKKLKKKELIAIIRKYEDEINLLTDKMEELSLNTDRVDYIYPDTNDSFIIKYLKRRIKCKRGMYKLPYITEYERIMNEQYTE